MIRKFKHTVSLLLLLVFVLPSIVKPIHHHHHSLPKTKSGIHYSEIWNKCVICSLEFSMFSHDQKEIEFRNIIPLLIIEKHYKSVYYPNKSQFSFSLRAPPSFLI